MTLIGCAQRGLEPRPAAHPEKGVSVNLREKTTLLLVTGDLALACVAVYAGHALRFGTLPLMEGGTALTPGQLPFFGAGVLFSSYLIELYNNRPLLLKDRLIRITLGLVLSFALLSVVYYALPSIRIGRGFFVLSLAVFAVIQLAWHLSFHALVNSEGLARKVLVLGTGLVAKKIGALITATNHQHVLRGYYSCDHEATDIPSQQIVGGDGGLIDVVRRERPQKIVVSLTEQRGTLPVRDILSCKLEGIEIVDAPSFYEEMTGKLLLEAMRPSWLIFCDGFRVTPFRRMYKRAFDIGAVLVGLTLSLPFLPFIALAIALDSEGPIFFRQIRVGEGEHPFELIKFRTMRKDAESGTGAVWAQKDDERVTRVGKFLRKVRLDEFPQLWNVLRGDMSLIGPRPERPEFVNKLKTIIPYYSERHVVKPGITGWAQIKYPYGASVLDAIEKLQFDLFYIKNMTPLLDLLIVVETIKVMLFGRGGR